MKFKQIITASMALSMLGMLTGCTNKQADKSEFTPSSDKTESASSAKIHYERNNLIQVSNKKTDNSITFMHLPSNKRTFPKQIRGKWYYYEPNDKKIHVEFFTSKKIGEYKNGRKHVVSILKAYKNHDVAKTSRKYQNKRQKWIYVDSKARYKNKIYYGYKGWNQAAGYSTLYNVSKINGHKVLSEATAYKVFKHAYRSRSLALKYKNKHYRNFSYDNFE